VAERADREPFRLVTVSSFPRRAGLAESRTARVVLAIAVFLAAGVMLHFWFYAHDSVGDRPLYQDYGQAVRGGQVPYRDFPVEYPPGALPAFIAPALPGHDYATWFDWLMAACGVGCVALVALSRPPRFALPFVAISPLLLGNLAYSRFDFWPTVLVAGGLAALLRDRHRLGWGMLAAAFAAKVFAAALVPLALVWTLRRRGQRELARSLAVFLAVVAVAFVPFAVIAPHGLESSLTGQLTRPLQIETLAASFLMEFSHPEIKSSHGSKNLPNHDGLAAATSVLALVLLLALWIAFARGPAEPGRLTRYAAACVCVFVAFGKVLSPQFLIWLVPLVPLTHGRRGLAATGLFAAALVNTEIWFPGRYFDDYVYAPHLAWLVLMRNLLLVATFVVLAVPSRVLRRRGAASTPTG
jgi:hypothetical protein